MFNVVTLDANRILLTCALAGMLISPAVTQPRRSAEGVANPTSASVPAPAIAVPNSVRSGHQLTLFRRRWGIDDVHVRSTASGALVRFSYRVVDADKAKLLNSKQATPYLFDETHGLALQIPVVDQVGQLRQMAAPENGRDYWMAFSNKGRYVKAGDHVALVIGSMRINGLVVE